MSTHQWLDCGSRLHLLQCAIVDGEWQLLGYADSYSPAACGYKHRLGRKFRLPCAYSPPECRTCWKIWVSSVGVTGQGTEARHGP